MKNLHETQINANKLTFVIFVKWGMYVNAHLFDCYIYELSCCITIETKVLVKVPDMKIFLEVSSTISRLVG